jgi:hypothetical protein
MKIIHSVDHIGFKIKAQNTLFSNFGPLYQPNGWDSSKIL